MKKILIATNNHWKFTEIMEVLGNLKHDFTNLKELGITEDIEEDWKNYEENAKIKAEFFAGISDLPTIADDSGIVVEALIWELWVKTRRWWAGAEASDEEWLDHFMKRMKDEENRRAEFFTSIAFLNWKEFLSFNWSCKWILLKEKKCESLPWIPLSSIFVPDGFDKPYSQLKIEEKNQISHRGKASIKLKEYLTNS